MGKTVAIGIQSFPELREGNYFYVDKTDFIKEWWENGDSVTLITRPRRFGKTLNMSMVESFFSVDYAGRSDLFEGLSIWEHENYRLMQGTYPVIFLSFANAKENNYRSAKERICRLIAELYNQNWYLVESGGLKENEKADFMNVITKKTQMTEEEAGTALNMLSGYLYRYHKKKVIIILDEYDTPMQEAYVNGYWDELVSFTRNLFNSTFKTNPYLARGLMTGITRVSRESIFSDLNNPEVVTTTSKKYAASFGFTEEEVFAAMDEYGYADRKEEIKHWYDGFIFGSHRDIYNPWSILNFLDKGKIAAYWANTSSNSLVEKLFREGDEEIKGLFEELLKGGNIRCPIDEQIVYNELDKNPDAIWSLLLASGYLRVISYEELNEVPENKEPMYELAVTNQEVRRMFRNMVSGWFSGSKRHYNGFVKALLAGDLKAMNVYTNDVTMKMLSYFDAGQKTFGTKEPERFFHGFVLGLIVDLDGEYIVTSNRESGLGRYDVMLEPRDDKKDAFILEFKVYDKDDEKTLEDTVASALSQIEEKKYDTLLIARGIPLEHIHKYGFAFKGKKVLIG